MRQLVSLDPFLAPLPKTARSLMRAAMMPRIFPRAAEMDVVFESESMLPEPTEVLMAIDPDTYGEAAVDDDEGD